MKHQSHEISFIKAGLEEVDFISKLFDKYREFYGQKSDFNSAASFIKDRIRNNESVIFLALEMTDDTKVPVGFIQMYPSFSSVSMKRVWILNDLYVEKSKRRNGIAKQLMEKAKSFAAETGAKGITLCTAIDNYPAQKLYESIGYCKNDKYYYYYNYFNN